MTNKKFVRKNAEYINSSICDTQVSPKHVKQLFIGCFLATNKQARFDPAYVPETREKGRVEVGQVVFLPVFCDVLVRVSVVSLIIA
jgi:hypothetical protein